MRSLDVMLLDEMIEQYRRFNPAPQYDEGDRPSLKEQMESELLVSLLTELQALRPRCHLYECRISHLNTDVKNLMIENANLKAALDLKQDLEKKP